MDIVDQRADVPARSHLVFVRAGADSLHATWMEQDPSRSWDCFVSYYGSPDELAEVPGDFLSSGGVSKLAHFAELHASDPDFFEAYEYICMADPDLEFAPGDITRLFAAGAECDLGLFQAGLSPDSYRSHEITLRRPQYRVRRTNFVEVMCPVFSRAALRLAVHTFADSISTWGLDYAWTRVLGDSEGIGIIDEVEMRHAKPIDTVNGAWYQKLRSMGIEAEDEWVAVGRKYGAPSRPRSYLRHSVPARGRPAVTVAAATRLAEFPRRVREVLGTLPRPRSGAS